MVSRFLLISLNIRAILAEATIARRRRRLNEMRLGQGLGRAYTSTLEPIKAQGGIKSKLGIAALMWLAHSERPLRIKELRHSSAAEKGATKLDVENAPSVQTLLGCPQGLATIDASSSTVRLIHSTLQEYLCTDSILFENPRQQCLRPV